MTTRSRDPRLQWLDRLLADTVEGRARLQDRFEAEQGTRDVDRFVDWLHEQGHLDSRQRDALRAERPVTPPPSPGRSRRPGDRASPLGVRYELVGELGRGSMGTVHLAEDPDLGRTVAVKVLLDQLRDHGETATRFLREAQVTAQLEHPNILPVYALEHTEEGLPAFAMKLVRGRTVADLVAACREAVEQGRPLRGELGLAARLDVFLRVCDAMAYAHDRGVVHRDLKPANLMLGAFREVYVVDWGIAKVVGEAADAPERLAELPVDVGTTATQAGYAVGTPAYMAPEQAAGDNDRVGPAADQYALGLLLHELITLARANDTGEVTSTLSRALQARRDPLRPPGGGRVPRDLEAIVDQATARRIEDRYPDVEALADDVRRFLRGEETRARPDNLLRRPVRWVKQHAVAATGLGLGAVLLAVVLIGALVVAGLAREAAQEAAARHREQAMTDMIQAVARRAHAIDKELLHHQGLLEQVASSAEDLLAYAPPSDGPVYTLEDLRAGETPADFGPSSHYGQGVSLDDPVAVLSPGVDRSAVAPELRRLVPLRHHLREVALRSHGLGALALDEAAARDLVLEQGVPLPWIYVGLESGVLINYPGNIRYSPDYDARQRPWYRAVVGERGPRWAEPYPDDSGLGLLLPCSVALYDDAGAFLGVAGASIRLADAIDRLDVGGVPAMEAAWLVDREGRIVVSSEQGGLDRWVGLNQDQALELGELQVEPVQLAIERGAASGHADLGGVIYAWMRMDALGWYYVARIDEAELLAGPPARGGP